MNVLSFLTHKTTIFFRVWQYIRLYSNLII
nr:MAG TPA: hypothetical protein [Caudoviricetes sp.]